MVRIIPPLSEGGIKELPKQVLEDLTFEEKLVRVLVLPQEIHKKNLILQISNLILNVLLFIMILIHMVI